MHIHRSSSIAHVTRARTNKQDEAAIFNLVKAFLKVTILFILMLMKVEARTEEQLVVAK